MATATGATAVPAVLGPLDVAGEWNEVAVAVGTGDNMAAAMGSASRTGDAVISVGTSGTAFTVSESPTADPSGEVAGFADATGRFLPLVCTSNAAKVVDAVARLLGVDHVEFDDSPSPRSPTATCRCCCRTSTANEHRTVRTRPD